MVAMTKSSCHATCPAEELVPETAGTGEEPTPRSLPLIVVGGNPNTGKTTVFNRLTGSRARVGNYPGVTVERRMGRTRIGEIGDVQVCRGGEGAVLDQGAHGGASRRGRGRSF
jgi:hypothetical protein